MPLDNIPSGPILSSGLKALEDQLAKLPDGKRGALVMYADEQGAHLGLAANLGNGWKVAAEVEKVFRSSDTEVVVGIVKTW